MQRRPSQFLFPFLLVTLLSGAGPGTSAQQPTPETLIDSSGQGINASPALAKQLAVNDAVREAIEQVLGAYVNNSASFKKSEDFETFEQRITKVSSGVGRVVSVLDERGNGETLSTRHFRL